MTPKERIREILMDAMECDLVDMYNLYMDEREIIPMDEFDEWLEGKKPSEIANMIHFGEWLPQANWFRFNKYGNIETNLGFNCMFDWIDVDEMADYVLENHESFAYPELEDLLEELFPNDWF